MEKRLFMAIPLSPEVTDALLEVKIAVLREVERAHGDSGIRWTAPENLHITTYFLGDVDEERIEELKENIKQTLAREPVFELKWKEILFAPPHHPPRMIWGEFDGSPDFTRLVQKCYEASRPFTDPAVAEKPHSKPIPHVTLARFKNPDTVKKLKLTQPSFGNATNPKEATLTVKTLELMASELGNDGSKYTVLHTYALT